MITAIWVGSVIFFIFSAFVFFAVFLTMDRKKGREKEEKGEGKPKTGEVVFKIFSWLLVAAVFALFGWGAWKIYTVVRGHVAPEQWMYHAKDWPDTPTVVPGLDEVRLPIVVDIYIRGVRFDFHVPYTHKGKQYMAVYRHDLNEEWGVWYQPEPYDSGLWRVSDKDHTGLFVGEKSYEGGGGATLEIYKK